MVSSAGASRARRTRPVRRISIGDASRRNCRESKRSTWYGRKWGKVWIRIWLCRINTDDGPLGAAGAVIVIYWQWSKQMAGWILKSVHLHSQPKQHHPTIISCEGRMRVSDQMSLESVVIFRIWESGEIIDVANAAAQIGWQWSKLVTG